MKYVTGLGIPTNMTSPRFKDISYNVGLLVMCGFKKKEIEVIIIMFSGRYHLGMGVLLD